LPFLIEAGNNLDKLVDRTWNGPNFYCHVLERKLIIKKLQPHVKSDYLGLIENIENIKNINWSSLILNVLLSSLREYKEVKTANLKGNVALLRVCICILKSEI
jgi:hypothetical protein